MLARTDLSRRDDAVCQLAVIDLDAELAREQRGAVMLLGNFDGIHKGHRALLEAGRRTADKLGAPLGIMSCEPHPRQFFNPSGTPFRLTSASAKRMNVFRAGFDILFEPRFDAAFANQSSRAFAEDILHGHLGVSAVVVGHDFHFGQKRSGTVEHLKDYGDEFGFEVCVVPPFMMGDDRLSSSLLREWLTQGALKKVSAGFAGSWATSLRLDENGIAHFEPSQCLPPEGAYQVEVMDDAGEFLSREVLELHRGGRGQMSMRGLKSPGRQFVGGWSQIDAF